ncbi:Aminotransferase class-III [Burkholderia sp. D7]|nr:Aminotransferase class-III [Burkholderia sp. D7]
MNTRQDLSGDLAAMRDTYVARGVVTAHPVFASHAAGAYLWDATGRKFLDFVAGIGVLNVGP